MPKVAADFKTVWDQFKATREEQMIPAIYKGSIDDAKKIADGIQLERFSKMWRIMSSKYDEWQKRKAIGAKPKSQGQG